MTGEEFELPPRSPRPRRRVQPGEIDFTPYQPQQAPEQQQEQQGALERRRLQPPTPNPQTQHQPAPKAPVAPEPAQRVKRNKNVNLSMPIDVMDQAKATWAHVAGAEECPRFAHFVTAALLDYIKQMEEKHNGGEPFPNPGSIILPTGAPPKES